MRSERRSPEPERKSARTGDARRLDTVDSGFGATRGSEQLRMPSLDVVDDTFVVGSMSELGPLCDERTWALWFPGIALASTEDRGRLGKRWTMTGELTGTAEVWLEQHADGVLVHTYLRQATTDHAGQRATRHAERLRRGYARALKLQLFAFKDELEGDRLPGEPRETCGWG